MLRMTAGRDRHLGRLREARQWHPLGIVTSKRFESVPIHCTARCCAANAFRDDCTRRVSCQGAGRAAPSSVGFS